MPTRTLTDAEIATALELRAQGYGIELIARSLKCGRMLVVKALTDAGMPIRRAVAPKAQTCRDPVTSYPIGLVPKGHPLYEADQEMARGIYSPKQLELLSELLAQGVDMDRIAALLKEHGDMKRYAYEGGSQGSSMAWD
jgi:hypothetical protein